MAVVANQGPAFQAAIRTKGSSTLVPNPRRLCLHCRATPLGFSQNTGSKLNLQAKLGRL
jgi:hypothetical protein